MMRSLLEIKPVHFDENNCYEDQIASVMNWWNGNCNDENILLCYANSWNFSYRTQLRDSDKSIGETLHGLVSDSFLDQYLYSSSSPLRKYYGMDLNIKYAVTFEELLISIRVELSANRPVILDLESSLVPWGVQYRNGDDYTHVIIIVGIDEENKQFVVTDGYYLFQNIRIDFKNVQEGFVKKFYTFNFYRDFIKVGTEDWRPVINDIITTLSSVGSKGFYDEMVMLAEDIDKSLDFKAETNKTKGYYNESKLHAAIRNLIQGRGKFSRLLKYFYVVHGIELFNILSNQMNTAATKWNKVQHMLVKASFMPEFTKIKENISNEILQLADYELTIYKRIVDTLEISENNFSKDLQKIEEAAVSLYLECLDISVLFNNKSFGGISEECDANIVSDTILPKAYFYNQKAPSNETIKLDNMIFKFPETGDGIADNISCKGQEIYMPPYAINNIMLLGCAEWGDFTEELTLFFDDGSSKKLVVSFTDWYKNPSFGEKIALKHKAVYTSHNGILEIDKYERYLFAKSYSIPFAKKIMKIKLPICPNIHIYAVSVGSKGNAS